MSPFYSTKLRTLHNVTEAAHLMPNTQQHARQVEQRVLLLHSQGRSVRFIADEMGLSRSKVGRMVKTLGEE